MGVWSRAARFRQRGVARGGRVSWRDAPAGGVTRGGARRGRAGKLRLEKLLAAESPGGGALGLPVGVRGKRGEAGATLQGATPQEAALGARDSPSRSTAAAETRGQAASTASLLGASLLGASGLPQAVPPKARWWLDCDARPGLLLGHVKRPRFCPPASDPGVTETRASEPQLRLGPGSATLQTPGLRPSAAAHHSSTRALAAQLPRAPC